MELYGNYPSYLLKSSSTPHYILPLEIIHLINKYGSKTILEVNVPLNFLDITGLEWVMGNAGCIYKFTALAFYA
jgi:hypothetical protein